MASVTWRAQLPHVIPVTASSVTGAAGLSRTSMEGSLVINTAAFYILNEEQAVSNRPKLRETGTGANPEGIESFSQRLRPSQTAELRRSFRRSCAIWPPEPLAN